MSNSLPEWWPEALEALRGMVREELNAMVEERKQAYLANIAAQPVRENSVWPHIRREASLWLLSPDTPLNVKPEAEEQEAPTEALAEVTN